MTGFQAIDSYKLCRFMEELCEKHGEFLYLSVSPDGSGYYIGSDRTVCDRIAREMDALGKRVPENKLRYVRRQFGHAGHIYDVEWRVWKPDRKDYYDPLVQAFGNVWVNGVAQCLLTRRGVA